MPTGLSSLYKTNSVAKKLENYGTVKIEKESDGTVYVNEYSDKGKFVKQLGEFRNKEFRANDRKFEQAVIKEYGRPKQEEGMKVHYDTTLPSVLKKLTGSEGERVSFGEHEKAFDVSGRLEMRNNVYHIVTDNPLKPRKDLIFHNPDGTPKTEVSARMFPLDKIPDRKPVLYGPRYSAPVASEGATLGVPLSGKANGGRIPIADALMKATPTQQVDINKLGLRDGMTAPDVLKSLASNGDHFGRAEAAMAQFLLDHFPRIIKDVKVNYGAHPELGRAAMEGKEVWLDVAGNHASVVNNVLEEIGHAATTRQYEHPTTALQFEAANEMDDIMSHSLNELDPKARAFFEDVYKPLLAEVNSGKQPSSKLWEAFDKHGIDLADANKMYAYTNMSEFIAVCGIGV